MHIFDRIVLQCRVRITYNGDSGIEGQLGARRHCPSPRNRDGRRESVFRAFLLGVDMRDRFSFGREDMAAICAGRISRKRGEARYVDKRRSEATTGSLAPIGKRRSASQHERRCITQGARATCNSGGGWGHGGEPRRRASAEIRENLARAFFRSVGFAMTTLPVLCSGHRKSGWNDRKGN